MVEGVKLNVGLLKEAIEQGRLEHAAHRAGRGSAAAAAAAAGAAHYRSGQSAAAFNIAVKMVRENPDLVHLPDLLNNLYDARGPEDLPCALSVVNSGVLHARLAHHPADVDLGMQTAMPARTPNSRR